MQEQSNNGTESRVQNKLPASVGTVYVGERTSQIRSEGEAWNNHIWSQTTPYFTQKIQKNT